MNYLTYDEESIYIGPDKKRYIRKNIVEELLEIRSHNIRLLKIPTIKLKDNSNAYDLDYIEKLIEDCRNFFSLHYTKTELISLTSRSSVRNGTFDEYKVKVPIDLQRILNKSVHKSEKGSRIAFRKADVDTLWKEISPPKAKCALLYESDTYIIDENNKKYVDKNTAISTLDSTAWCFNQMDIPYLISKNRKFYELQYIESLIEEYNIFFDKHYTRKEAEKLTSTHFINIIPGVKIPADLQRILIHKKDSVGQLAYLKTDVEIYLSKNNIKPRSKYRACGDYFLDENERKYISYETAMDLLEVSRRYLQTSDIPFIYGDNNVKLFDFEYIQNLINDCKQFFKDHYPRREALNLTTRKMVEYVLPKVNIPSTYQSILNKSLHNGNKVGRIAYLKSDVHNAQKETTPSMLSKDSMEHLVNEGLYISLDSCLNSLNIPIRTLRTFFTKSSEYHLDTFMFGGIKYVKTEDINRIKNLQQIFFNNYISTTQAKEIYFKDIDISKVNEVLKRYSPPIYIPTTDDIMGKKSVFYKLSEVEDFINEESNDNIFHLASKANSGLYLNLSDCSELLGGLHERSLAKSLEDISAFEDSFMYKTSRYIKKEYIDILKSKQEEFYKNYIRTNDEYIISIFKKYNTSYLKYILNLYDIPPYIPCVGDFFGLVKVYKRSEVNKLLSKCESIEKAFFDEYIFVQEAENTLLYDYEYTRAANILERFDVPDCLKVYNGQMNNKCYRLSDVHNFTSSNERKIIIDHNLFGTSNYDTFLLRLESTNLWDKFNDNTEYTKNIWFKYCKRYLNKTQSKGEILQGIISTLIRVTVELKKLLDVHEVNEIYLLSSNKINFFQNTLSISYQMEFYRFLRYVYADLSHGKNRDINCKFNLKNINNPNYITEEELDKKKQDKSIYEFEIYSEIFNYCTDLDKHIKLSLEEIRTYNTCTYASSWLYVMLHLNNAWRHGDVRDFPQMVNIFDLVDQLEINDFSWFDNNKLEIKVARAVIERIRQWEIIISKTQMKGVFFCSDELAPSLSSAILLLTLFHKKYNIIGLETLMIFNTSNNNISKTQLETFFTDINIENFTFYSRKFNRTIMSYVYYIANLSGDSKSALYSKIMRSHVNLNSTTHYLDFRGINSLSKQLFQRGEFGFVATLLAYKLNNNEIGTFEEVTKHACKLNNAFGSIQSINANVGFLNTVYGDYKHVIEYLETKTFEETQLLLADLYARKLSSIEGCDTPCLLGNNNCKYPGKYQTCFECTFHIPTIYALSTLCEYLRKDMELFYSTNNLAKKFQISKRFAAKRRAFVQAINILGEDYVYGCLGMPKNDFIEEVITFNITSKRLLQQA